MALANPEGNTGRMLVLAKLLEELLADLCRHVEGFLLVEVVTDANHHVGNQRILRIGRRQRDIAFQCLVKISREFIALCELVLGVGSQRVIGVLLDDHLVRLDGLGPLFQFLRELTQQVADPRHVLGIGIVLHHLSQHPSPVPQVGSLLVIPFEFLVALEQLEVTLGNMKLRLDCQVLVVERLAEGRDQPVCADHHGNVDGTLERPVLGSGHRIVVDQVQRVAEVTLDDGHLGVEIADDGLVVGLQGQRTRENSAVHQCLFQFHRFLFTEFPGDLDGDRIAFVRGVLVGVLDLQEQAFSDMQPVDRLEVVTIGDGQLAVGNQPTAGIQPLGDTVRTRLIVVAGHDAVLAGEIEHAGDQAVVQGLELFITFLLGDRRTADQ